MKYILYYILYIIYNILCPQAFACKVEFKLLKVNDPAPCNGYFLSEDKELEVRYKLLMYDTLENKINFLEIIVDRQDKLIDEYKMQVKLEERKTNLWREQAIKSTDELVNQTDYSSLYYVGGIITAIIVGRSIK